MRRKNRIKREKPLNKKSKSPTAKAKERAWKAFSLYIRTRDALKTTGRPDVARCFTCQTVFAIRDLQAGHFIPGRRNSILFDERGCHAQCRCCNYLNGNPVEYFRAMQYSYGDEVIDELREKNRVNQKWTTDEYTHCQTEFLKKLDALHVQGGVSSQSSSILTTAPIPQHELQDKKTLP